ncbi:hypothetical protein BJ742DRAFT_775960 [Cladochytrium replicatum]|nr:hypothetical protein BJ742DRAFT_775960 [Cladochytrium replicatum]
MTGRSSVAYSDLFTNDALKGVIDYGTYGVLGIPSREPPTSLMTGSSTVYNKNKRLMTRAVDINSEKPTPIRIEHQLKSRGMNHGIYGVIGVPGITPALSLMTGSKDLEKNVLRAANKGISRKPRMMDISELLTMGSMGRLVSTAASRRQRQWMSQKDANHPPKPSPSTTEYMG